MSGASKTEEKMMYLREKNLETFALGEHRSLVNTLVVFSIVFVVRVLGKRLGDRALVDLR